MSEPDKETTMKPNESTRDNDLDRHRSTDAKTNDNGPDHDVPVAEQLTERQRDLVGRDGGGG
jgi:hypothetical protein